MIFAFLIIVVFAGIMAFGMFGSQPNPAVPKAQIYAQNMAVFHQAAMLQVNADLPVPPWPSCSGSPSCDAYPLNNRLLITTSSPYIIDTTHQLYKNWPEYLPMVPETVSTGWQSFLIRQINGITGAAPPPADPTATESYVLTIFRGFGGGCLANKNMAQSFGNNGADSFGLGLAKTMTERAGLGILNCSANGANGLCTFNRYAADTNGNEKPLKFSTKPLGNVKDNSNVHYFSSPGQAATVINGCVAMMTRVTAP